MLNKILHAIYAFTVITTLAMQAALAIPPAYPKGHAGSWGCVCGFTGYTTPFEPKGQYIKICKSVNNTDNREQCDWQCMDNPNQKIFDNGVALNIAGKTYINTNHFYEGYGDPLKACWDWCNDPKSGKCATNSWDLNAIKDYTRL
jgi:hypothetical protein